MQPRANYSLNPSEVRVAFVVGELLFVVQGHHESTTAGERHAIDQDGGASMMYVQQQQHIRRRKTFDQVGLRRFSPSIINDAPPRLHRRRQLPAPAASIVLISYNIPLVGRIVELMRRRWSGRILFQGLRSVLPSRSGNPDFRGRPAVLSPGSEYCCLDSIPSYSAGFRLAWLSTVAVQPHNISRLHCSDPTATCLRNRHRARSVSSAPA